MVIQYLPEAFAFIYVINSTNTGGIQKDRVSNDQAAVESVLSGHSRDFRNWPRKRGWPLNTDSLKILCWRGQSF